MKWFRKRQALIDVHRTEDRRLWVDGEQVVAWLSTGGYAHRRAALDLRQILTKARVRFGLESAHKLYEALSRDADG